MLRYKSALALLLLLPAAMPIIHAQDILGQWQGTLQSDHPRRVVLEVSNDNTGKLQAYFVPIDDSPDHFAVAAISVSNGELDFSVLGGSYHGNLSKDGDRVNGTLTQGSFQSPFELQRVTEDKSWLTKSKTQLITVAPGVSLEVIDWGGSGPPLIFLAGLGNTAHTFDNFAPKFVPQYHAYGITRGGFGASSTPAPTDSNYTADQLGDDVLKVIDALGLKKPVLIGHSIAGEELSSIGSRHPEKVAGLIYLDAGYSYALYLPDLGDYTQTDIDAEQLQKDLNTHFTVQLGADPEITAKILAELPLLQKDLGAEQKLAQLMPPPPAAQTEAQPPPFADAAAAIMRGGQKYTNIQAPLLAILVSPHNPAHLRVPADKRAEYIAFDQASMAAHANAFEKLKSAKVVIIPNADHYVFVSNEQEVEKDIRDFLATLNANEN